MLVKSADRAAIGAHQRAWYCAVRELSGHSQTEIAARSGVGQNTLSRFESGQVQVLDARTVGRIVEAYGVPSPDQVPHIAETGFGEGRELSPGMIAKRSKPVSAAIRALLDGNPKRSVWLLNSRALEGAGRFAGDLLIVDGGESPRIDDPVCAKVTDSAGSRIVFRFYGLPALYAASSDPRVRRPISVDPELVIVGTIVAALTIGRGA